MADSLDGSALAANSVTETQLISTFTDKVNNAYTVANLSYAKANTTLSTSGNTSITGNISFESGARLTLNTTMVVEETVEKINVSATSLGATLNYDVMTQAILYLTSNATANCGLNFRGNTTTTMESFLSTGQSITVSLLVTNGSTPYLINSVAVDSIYQLVKWAGGTIPSFGNQNSVDLYSFTIVKTAPLNYTIFGSQQKYA